MPLLLLFPMLLSPTQVGDSVRLMEYFMIVMIMTTRTTRIWHVRVPYNMFLN